MSTRVVNHPKPARASNTATGQPIYYVYDSQDIAAQVDGSGNLIALFTHGPNIDEPLELRQGSGTEYFIHADALGSVIAHTDGTGTVVERVAYEAYGQPVFLDMRSGSPVVESQSFTGDPFAFTGREWDGERGQYFYRNRQTYDPITGRYGQQDDNFAFLVSPQTLNPYAYVENQPSNFVDPTGLYSCLYSITDHTMLCVPNNPTNRVFYSSQFLSGLGQYQNNPAYTKAPFQGPIPPGWYWIGPFFRSGGHIRIPLLPQPNTNTYGRRGFQIHNCPLGHEATCSTGCIATEPENVLEELNGLLNRENFNQLRVDNF